MTVDETRAALFSAINGAMKVEAELRGFMLSNAIREWLAVAAVRQVMAEFDLEARSIR